MNPIPDTYFNFKQCCNKTPWLAVEYDVGETETQKILVCRDHWERRNQRGERPYQEFIVSKKLIEVINA